MVPAGTVTDLAILALGGAEVRANVMGTNDTFTLRKFALTLMSVMAFFAVMFLFLFLCVNSSVFGDYSIRGDINLSFAIPASLYLSFIAGWGLAYSKYFRFPEKQRVLLLGIVIGGSVMPVLIWPYRLYFGQASMADVLISLPGTLLGAAFQLYGLVICLRYILKVKWPF